MMAPSETLIEEAHIIMEDLMRRLKAHIYIAMKAVNKG